MKPARQPRSSGERVRLLALDPLCRAWAHRGVGDLPSLLHESDVLVVNDAATLPGSLCARTESGASVELRLLGPHLEGVWHGVLFGAGDWQTPTEQRPAPPRVAVGERLRVGDDGSLIATVAGVSSLSARLLELVFGLEGEELWRAIYRLGRPVQYSHLDAPLDLWSVQTGYAARPWAAEAPSAGLPLSWEILHALTERGVMIAALTHAAGLSATGDPALDAALPLPERYDVPAGTVRAIERARARGGRIVAAGTSVVRALEASARAHGSLRAGEGITDLRIDERHRLAVVDGLLTGIHEPTESHYALLGAFLDGATLARAWRHALSLGYLGHEFGDAALVLGGVLSEHARPPRYRARGTRGPRSRRPALVEPGHRFAPSHT